MQNNPKNKLPMFNSEGLDNGNKNPDLVVFKVSASWCGPCGRESFINSVKDAAASNPSSRFIAVDGDRDTSLNVGSYPSIVIINPRTGQTLDTISGAVDTDTINERLKSIRSTLR